MGPTTFAELDALSTDDLRQRAFDRAQKRGDVSFFWRLFEHLPAPGDGSDGSLGLESSVDDAVALWRETTGHTYGDQEPLIRAAFIDYLLKH
jgi:hypothetical protein